MKADGRTSEQAGPSSPPRPRRPDGGWAPSEVDVGPPPDNLVRAFRRSSCWEGGSPGSYDRVAGVAAPWLPWGGVRVWAHITTYGDFDPHPPDPPHPPKGLFWGSKRGWG